MVDRMHNEHAHKRHQRKRTEFLGELASARESCQSVVHRFFRPERAFRFIEGRLEFQPEFDGQVE